jgi:hypothetical protein
MKVIADKEVIDYLKGYFSDKPNKAVRFERAEICCGNCGLDFAYDEIRENDICYEIEGIKFVVDKDFGFLIDTVEMEKTEYGVDIKRRYSC